MMFLAKQCLGDVSLFTTDTSGRDNLRHGAVELWRVFFWEAESRGEEVSVSVSVAE